MFQRQGERVKREAPGYQEHTLLIVKVPANLQKMLASVVMAAPVAVLALTSACLCCVELQFADNSRGNPGVPATPNEIQLYLINLTGGTIQAGTEAPFSISVGTLANPQV